MTTNTNQEYDPAADMWTTRSSTGFTPRYLLAAAVVDGRIYTIGGTGGTNRNQEYTPPSTTLYLLMKQ